jgi:hypothetical protein
MQEKAGGKQYEKGKKKRLLKKIIKRIVILYR